MEYIYQIFKEIVFCRPLPYCYALVSNLMMIFIKSTTYLRKLCINSSMMFIVLIAMILHVQFLQKKKKNKNIEKISFHYHFYRINGGEQLEGFFTLYSR